MLTVTETVFERVARAVIDSISDALTYHNLDVPERRFVGFSRPAEDACPDLVAWVSNIRPWDQNFPDGRANTTLNNFFNGWAFDVNVRLGVCVIDFDGNGQPLDGELLEEWSSTLYHYAHTMYVDWVHRWRAGQVNELSECDYVDVGACTDYKEGGCGGWEFRITVGVL